MKNQIVFSSTIFLLIFLSACNKEKDIPTEINYLKIAVNGVEYKTENAAISGFPVLNCEEKNAILARAGKIDNAELSFEFFLNHYEYLSDFESAYQSEKHYVSKKENSVTCHFGAAVEFNYKVENDDDLELMLDARNTINKVSQLDENSTEVKYAISGSFKCNFFSKSGKEIQIIGDYNVLARVLKQQP